MQNLVLAIPTPVSILLLTLLVSFVFAVIARVSGECAPDPASGLKWGGPASELVSYTLLTGIPIFIIAATGWPGWLVWTVTILLSMLHEYNAKVLHPVVRVLLDREQERRKGRFSWKLHQEQTTAHYHHHDDDHTIVDMFTRRQHPTEV